MVRYGLDAGKKSKALKEAALFFALTLGLSFFVFWGPLAFFQVPAISFVSGVAGPSWAIALYILGGFVPSLVAVLMTGVLEGRPGLGRLGRRIIQFKIGWRWYFAALALVVLATLAQLLIISLLGLSFDSSVFVAQLGSLLPLLVLGPLSEEIGWRGYALDRLQTRWTPLVSSLLVGLAWGLWHFPLFKIPGTSQQVLQIPFIGFLVGILSVSVLFTWLHNNTGLSIWTAIFFHWIYTYAAQVVASGVTRTPLYNWIEYLPYVIEAVLVVVIWRSQLLARPAEAAPGGGRRGADPGGSGDQRGRQGEWDTDGR